MNKPFKLYFLDPETEDWNRAAVQLQISVAPRVYKCKKCNAPVLEGYCCGYCGSRNPYDDFTPDELLEIQNQLSKEVIDKTLKTR